MPDDEELDRQSFVSQLAVGLRQDIQILLFGNPADIKQAHFAVGRPTEFAPKRRIALLRIEQLMIESARKNLQLRRVEATFDPTLAIFFRVYENSIELAVKPVHVIPRHAFPETVVGQDANVLREISVINAARLQVEHFRGEQSG